MAAKFYYCRHCKNLVGMVQDSGVNPVCCGEDMKELKAGEVDASQEKHVPVVVSEKLEAGLRLMVSVGSVEHPMASEHYIQWIFVETDKGGHRRALNPGDVPKASFIIPDDEKVIAVYEYCNLHGLWKHVMA